MLSKSGWEVRSSDVILKAIQAKRHGSSRSGQASMVAWICTKLRAVIRTSHQPLAVSLAKCLWYNQALNNDYVHSSRKARELTVKFPVGKSAPCTCFNHANLENHQAGQRLLPAIKIQFMSHSLEWSNKWTYTLILTLWGINRRHLTAGQDVRL